ncbi:MAG: DeoR family transcriptional regulator [Ardenticatenaceae bacterium]|nr:DeoR family transcriptional regulator [Anaerolineales bacterium]MCB8922185.1 DeoR family transcriptional regulator [Ardenticatenaceae bacterium]
MVKITGNNHRKSTREIILETIKASRQAKVEDLAEAANVSPVTVRHHLNSLQAEGLIESNSVRRKVGRPYYVYSLSEQGQELFPKRYVRLTTRLLEELKAVMPSEAIDQVFKGVVQTVVDDHRPYFEGQPIEKRLDYLVSLLEEEGFLARWEKTEDGYSLTEYNCPYYSIGQEHIEICTFDTELIAHVVQAPIRQHSCMVQGADCCQFSIADATANS